MAMEIVTGSTGVNHVTPVDDAVRNCNVGYYDDCVVFDALEGFRAQKQNDNLVKIFSGYGMMQGRIFKLVGSENVAIISGEVGTKRCDLICARYRFDETTNRESVTLEVIEGQQGNSWREPDFNHTGNINEDARIFDFPLYRAKLDGTTLTLERYNNLNNHINANPITKGGRIGEMGNRVDNLGTAFNALSAKIDALPSDIGDAASQTFVNNKVSQLQSTFRDGVNTIVDELTARKGSLIVESATVSTPTPYDVAHNINMMMYELYMHGMSYVADNNGDSSAGAGTGIAESTDGHGNSYYEITEGDIMNLMRLIAESNYSAGRNA